MHADHKSTQSIFSRAIGGETRDVITELFKNKWWIDLLKHWCPSGRESEDTGLRLTIRNGYLSFYRHGQSVAKVSVDRSKRAKLVTHLKYIVDAPRLREGFDAKRQHYATLSQGNRFSCKAFEGTLPEYDSTSNFLDKWIERAGKHAGSEKTFVDRLVAGNSNVIDLEMGLPGFDRDGSGDLVAPRMDIVALEEHQENSTLVFWEAKMMGNGELRAKKGLPKVYEQLQNYRAWIRIPNHDDQVIRAYKKHCEILLETHDMATKFGLEIPPLGKSITCLARSTTLPKLDPVPRLVICDYEKNTTWISNGHASKLSDLGIPFKAVQTELPEGLRLNSSQ